MLSIFLVCFYVISSICGSILNKPEQSKTLYYSFILFCIYVFLALPYIRKEFIDASFYQIHVQTFQKEGKTSAVTTKLRQNSRP